MRGPAVGKRVSPVARIPLSSSQIPLRVNAAANITFKNYKAKYNSKSIFGLNFSGRPSDPGECPGR